jgi:hypothetical protein
MCPEVSPLRTSPAVHNKWLVTLIKQQQIQVLYWVAVSRFRLLLSSGALAGMEFAHRATLWHLRRKSKASTAWLTLHKYHQIFLRHLMSWNNVCRIGSVFPSDLTHIWERFLLSLVNPWLFNKRGHSSHQNPGLHHQHTRDLYYMNMYNKRFVPQEVADMQERNYFSCNRWWKMRTNDSSIEK